jgi:hypothetical protein
MLARYLLVRGVPGRLVANPHVPAHTRRFLGKLPSGVFWDEGPIDPETGQPRWPAAEPVEEVVLDEPSIRKAAKGGRGDLTSLSERGQSPPVGDIEILGETTAHSLEEARKKLMPAKAPRAEK